MSRVERRGERGATRVDASRGRRRPARAALGAAALPVAYPWLRGRLRGCAAARRRLGLGEGAGINCGTMARLGPSLERRRVVIGRGQLLCDVTAWRPGAPLAVGLARDVDADDFVAFNGSIRPAGAPGPGRYLATTRRHRCSRCSPRGGAPRPPSRGPRPLGGAMWHGAVRVSTGTRISPSAAGHCYRTVLAVYGEMRALRGAAGAAGRGSASGCLGLPRAVSGGAGVSCARLRCLQLGLGCWPGAWRGWRDRRGGQSSGAGGRGRCPLFPTVHVACV